MATMYRYQLPVEQTQWTLQGETQTSFTWEYEDERSKLLALYDKGKKQQWDAAERIDWSIDLDPENPQQLDDRAIPIYGSPLWDRLTKDERVFRSRRQHLRFERRIAAGSPHHPLKRDRFRLQGSIDGCLHARGRRRLVAADECGDAKRVRRMRRRLSDRLL